MNSSREDAKTPRVCNPSVISLRLCGFAGKLFLLSLIQTFLFVSTNIALGQFGESEYTVDTLMLTKHVKIRTHKKCDENCNNCIVLSKIYYDDLGRKDKEVSFVAGTPWSTYYYYNKLNELETEYTQLNDDPKYITLRYKYDKEGHLIEYLRGFPESCCELMKKLEYNSEGKLVKEVEYQNGKEYIQSNYKYLTDTGGIKLELTTNYQINFMKDMNEQVIMSFNKNNFLSKSVHFNKDGKISNTELYEFNKRGKNIYYNSLNGNKKREVKYEYTYDSAGNEIEYKSTELEGDVLDHKTLELNGVVTARNIMTFEQGLLRKRIQYINGKIEMYANFEYEFYK